MNNICFKVWDKQEKKWATVRNLLLDRNFNESGVYGLSDLDLNRFIFLLSAGVKDKNNKIIFEKDIVKVNPHHEAILINNIFHDPKVLEKYNKATIEFFNSSFYVCQFGIGATLLSKFFTCHCCPSALEIIGNELEDKKE